jgi:hypothetical protein
MASTVTLSYYATAISYTLPINTEIETSPDIAHAYGGRRVVRVDTHFVVKFGRGVNLIEGENMLFIQRVTSIPVLKVFALYTDA